MYGDFGIVSAFSVVADYNSFAGILAAYKARKEAHPVLLALGVPYIALGLGSIAWIYQVTDWVGIMWLILAVWSVDVGGYVFGTTLKGPKLAPKISPNKTWSGLIGGVVLAGVVCGFFVIVSACKVWR